MNALHIPHVYRIPGLDHAIVTIHIDASIVTPLWIAFFDHEPRACTSGKDEANAVFTLLKRLAGITPAEEEVTQQGASPEPEQPAPHTKTTETFYWDADMIALLKQGFQAAKTTSPKQSIEQIARDLAGKHTWPLGAVKYKIFQLKLQKQVPTPTEPPALPILAPGNVSWQARVDGMPLTWKLDYPNGSFPFGPNTTVQYQNQLYRIRRAGEMTLDVTSEEADRYEVQHA